MTAMHEYPSDATVDKELDARLKRKDRYEKEYQGWKVSYKLREAMENEF